MRTRRTATAVALSATGAALMTLMARGAMVLDTGVGRRYLPLGPLHMTVHARPETVFDVIAEPYLHRTPHAMAHKLQVLERGSDMVLAAHFTTTRWFTTTTVETVRFERPSRVTFRLVRGPVPHVVETFDLRPADDGCEFEYRGELGTDFWAVGHAWGTIVGRTWEATVRESLDSIQTEAERRATHR